MRVKKEGNIFIVTPEQSSNHDYQTEKQFLKQLTGTSNFSVIHFPVKMEIEKSLPSSDVRRMTFWEWLQCKTDNHCLHNTGRKKTKNISKVEGVIHERCLEEKRCCRCGDKSWWYC
jgi:hypothetical protein